MIRILLKTLILYFSLTTILFSQIISSIDITGNKRISKESIIVFSEDWNINLKPILISLFV